MSAIVRLRLPISVRWVSVVVALALLGTGCSLSDGGGEPDESPTTSTISSPSPIATPTWAPERPEMPTEAKKFSDQGARAFALYYYDVFEYARHTGNWKPLKKLTLSSCKTCRKLWSGPSRHFHPYGPAKRKIGKDSSRVDDDWGLVFVKRTSSSGVWKPGDDEAAKFQSFGWLDDFELQYRESRWKVKKLEIGRNSPRAPREPPYKW